MKIKIKGNSYLVKFVDFIKKDEDTETVGDFVKNTKTIRIVKGKTVNFTADTILHELVHAFLYECGLDDCCSDEDIVCWMSRQLLDIFDCFIDVFEKQYPEFKGQLIKSRKVIYR